MSDIPAGNYRLVVFAAVDDPVAVRDLVCRITGDHPTEVMQWVSKTPGLWPRPFDESQVRDLLDGLFEMKVPAEAWRVDQLPKLTPIKPVHVAACLDDGLRIGGLHGEPAHWIPWPKLDLISAGRIAPTEEGRAQPPGLMNSVADGLNAIILRKPASARRIRAPRPHRDPYAEILLVRRDPRITFRVAEDQMSYAYLEHRLRDTAAENFPLFLGDLCEKATDAYVTHPTRALLEAGDPAGFTFNSQQDLVDFTMHRLLWAWYCRDRDRQQPSDDGTIAE